MKLTNKSVFAYDDAYKVNTVNNRGYMGKGLALEFKIRSPETNEFYIKHYQDKKGGDILVDTNRKIIHVFTKEDFANPSKVEWVRKALYNLKELMLNDTSIFLAMPILGAGNGNLDKEMVINMTKDILSQVGTRVVVCQATVDTETDAAKLHRIISAYENNLDLDLAIDKSKQEILRVYGLGKIKMLRDVMKIKNIGPKKYQEILSKNIESKQISKNISMNDFI